MTKSFKSACDTILGQFGSIALSTWFLTSLSSVLFIAVIMTPGKAILFGKNGQEK